MRPPSPPPVSCFQCQRWIKPIWTEESINYMAQWRYEEHICTPRADSSLIFQRKMIKDLMVFKQHPDNWLTDPCMLDRRTGERVTRVEMFDRMATALAVCIEFGV